MGAVEFVSIALPAVFWSLVVGLIAWGQRKPIGRLIDRIRGGRAFGAEFDAPPPDLAEAVEGGASSPEVEGVIRSAYEAAKQSIMNGEPSSVGETTESTASFEVESSARESDLLARLTDAQRLDEDRRRADIERVMKSAARWGAKLARNAPDDAGEWEPVVRWKDDGEPEIKAIRGPHIPTVRLQMRQHQLRAAEHVHAQAIDNLAVANRQVATANTRLRDAEPSAELAEWARKAEIDQARAREALQVAEAELDAIHRHIDELAHEDSSMNPGRR